jgi:arylsulfatase A-like enzyme
MNLICISLDSFRQDHVGTYHGGNAVFEDVPVCATPNIDRFARDCVVFDNAYPEALPTIPIRTQLFTGQGTLPFRPWQPLTKEDITITEILKDEDYVCGLITDLYHFRAPGMNFHRGFHAYEWIRGQEYDPWKSHPPTSNIDDYTNSVYTTAWRTRVRQILANTEGFSNESEWFAQQVVHKSIDWLKKNRNHKRVFAWIDSFDPHEPWDPPARFDIYTDPDYRGPRLIMPMGGEAAAWASEAEIRHIRGLYAGEAAFVDEALGHLFTSLKELGYYEDSLIVLLADHGHPLADHGKFLKGADRMYNELLKVPFMIRLPGGQNPHRTQALVQFPDVLPTVLDLLGLGANTAAMHGRSFRKVVEGEADNHRQSIIAGYHEGLDRCIRDKTWSYILRPAGEPDELYHLQDDPHERTNLIDQIPEEAGRLARMFGSYFKQSGGPVEVKGIQGKYELGSSAI